MLLRRPSVSENLPSKQPVNRGNLPSSYLPLFELPLNPAIRHLSFCHALLPSLADQLHNHNLSNSSQLATPVSYRRDAGLNGVRKVLFGVHNNKILKDRRFLPIHPTLSGPGIWAKEGLGEERNLWWILWVSTEP